jgi:hypothetical protein
MTPQQKVLVQTTFARIAPSADEAAAMFYERLFELDSTLRPLFKGDLREQGRKRPHASRRHGAGHELTIGRRAASGTWKSERPEGAPIMIDARGEEECNYLPGPAHPSHGRRVAHGEDTQ